MNPAIDITQKTMTAADAWYWAHAGKLNLLGGKFKTEGYEYLVEPLRSDARRICQKKSTQKGYTQINIIRAIHRCKYGKYKQGVLYLFPTRGDVTDFSNSRFKPMISENPKEIGAFVKDTDQANLKRIGDAFLFFRGARMSGKTEGGTKDAHQLKGIPVDEVIFDEFDEMPVKAEDLALSRMENSPYKNETYLANPTIPDFGIDRKYQESDQKVWMIKCDKCGRYTCLELEFPNCLERLSNGKVIRLCAKCRDREIYPKNGMWVAQYPDKTKHMEGYWSSHLMSIRTSMTELLDTYEDPRTDITLFHNLRLGMAHIKAEDRLTVNEVLARCSTDAMDARHKGPCAMGVDVGSDLHVTIGTVPYPGGIKVVKMARVSTFTDVHDLAKRFGVVTGVFDLYPETRKVREFGKAANFEVFGCDYQESQKGAFAWNEQSCVVTVNRTEVCDATHNLVATKNLQETGVALGNIELPREDEEVRIYAKQMCNTAKVLVENDETGKKVYRYRGKLGGPDDYRHSTNYLYLACERIRPIMSGHVPAVVPKAEYKYD